MGTQNQTPTSQTPDKHHSGMAGEQAQRDPRANPGSKGKDAGNVPHSDDDVAGETPQGSRQDSGGSSGRSS